MRTTTETGSFAKFRALAELPIADLGEVASHEANYPCDYEVADDDIPAHDILLAGFPCQPLSIAGVRKKESLGRLYGFHCDVQGTLFFDVAHILKNVERLLRHDQSCYRAA